MVKYSQRTRAILQVWVVFGIIAVLGGVELFAQIKGWL